MNRDSINGVWRRVRSAITRQPHRRGAPDDDQLFGLRNQPSTFSLSSISSTLRNPRTFLLKNYSSNLSDATLQRNNAQVVVTTTETQSQTYAPRPPRERWIIGVRQCANVGAFILILNLVFIFTAAGLARRFPENSKFGATAVLYKGKCSTTKTWDVALHFVINGLSTFILGASNYCMQSLVAPTRQEVDKAHAQGIWLDIGCASIKNLRAIGRSRLILWIVLMLTATPFHLLYNSMLFESLSTNEFGAMVGPKDLNSSNVYDLTTPAINKCVSCPSINGISDYTPYLNWSEIASELANNNYERRKFSDCRGSSQTGVRAVIMLAENLTVSDGGNAAILATDNSEDFMNQSVLAIPYFYTNGSHNASAECQSSESVYVAYQYEVYGGPYLSAEQAIPNSYVTHECLVIRAPQHCQLLYSPPICLVIAIAAFAKVCAMFMAARITRKRGKPLLTVGDAIASFISKPDPTTKDLCWMSGKDVRKGAWKQSNELEDESAIYKTLSKPRRWLHAPTRLRWSATLILCFGCIFVSIWLLFAAIAGMPYDSSPFLSSSQFTNIFSSNVNENDYGVFYIYNGHPTMISYVVVANTPQLLVTMCYYCYNAVLSSMLAASEFDSYAKKRKALRVHWPVRGSEQRTTYWLSVPYRYCIPVLALYMVLHWLISQAIFYLSLIPYTVFDEVVAYESINAVGFTSSYVFLSILVGAVMVTIPCSLAWRKFKSNMPLAGSCSAAISAACHPPAHEDLSRAVLGKVKWGQVILPGQPIDSLQPNDSENGHCTFTSLETVDPTLTKMYA
ncbi:hypothetical protein N7478_009441 [Penicillium angulare]|uniref:uncharacterized protein n=1 Tax=Penicillium angulare TaxID=116970 RepID=UPI00253F849B|nr:uncharacterized protein N7478_009441 [Penicillium angulare]KAJ5266633.1 hypothetical protein N7478_009441 [Penicillium angulare]